MTASFAAQRSRVPSAKQTTEQGALRLIRRNASHGSPVSASRMIQMQGQSVGQFGVLENGRLYTELTPLTAGRRAWSG